jgi:hypothetical protein
VSRHKGRAAVITGAALGLGRDYARRLASERARIIVADVAPACQTRQLVRPRGRRPRRATTIAYRAASKSTVAVLGGSPEPAEGTPDESGTAPLATSRGGGACDRQLPRGIDGLSLIEPAARGERLLEAVSTQRRTYLGP